MKQILLVCFLLSHLVVINAQKSIITLHPLVIDTVIQMNLSKTNLEANLQVTIRNNTNDTIFLKWERNVINMPKSWMSRVCDDNFCYPQAINSNIDPSLYLNEPLRILPRRTNKLQVHFVPNGMTGTGKIELEFATTKQPNIVIGVAEFNIEITGATSAVEMPRKPLRVYPNPSGNYLTVSDTDGVARIVVYNMVGREVKSFQVEDNSTYDIGNLSDGIYLVGLFDKKGNVIKTLRVSKRGVRP